MNKHSIYRHIPLSISSLPPGSSGSYLDILRSIQKCFSVLSFDYEFEALFIARFRIEYNEPYPKKPQEHSETDESELSQEIPRLPETKSKMLDQLTELIHSRMIDEATTPRHWKALIKNPKYNNAFERLVESFILRLRDDDFFPRFVWTREIPKRQSSLYPIRYNLLLFTDGRLSQSAEYHMSILSKILNETALEDGTRYCMQSIPILLDDEFHSNGVVIHPKSSTYQDKVAQVFHSVSDIALRWKPFSLPIGCLEFGRSDLPGWKPTLRALIDFDALSSTLKTPL